MNKSKLTMAILALSLLTACGSKDNTANSDSKTATKKPASVTEENSTNDKKENSERADADSKTGEIKLLEEGDMAPDFTATLVNGETFHMSDYDDKVVLLNFWATWCPPCVGEMPAFEMLKDDNLENVEIVCINAGEDKETVNQFVKMEGYTFNIGYDEDYSIEDYYPTDGIPYTLVVNKGVISKIYVGANGAEAQYKEYKAAITECLK